MLKHFVVALVFSMSAAQAGEVQLSLLEKNTALTTAYAVETSNLSLRPIAQVQGAELSQLSAYKSENGKLVSNGTVLADAD